MVEEGTSNVMRSSWTIEVYVFGEYIASVEVEGLTVCVYEIDIHNQSKNHKFKNISDPDLESWLMECFQIASLWDIHESIEVL